MRLLALPILLLLSGCATAVYHPTRTLEQQKKDIEICHEHGTLTTNFNAISALDEVFKCLEAKGYRKGKAPAGQQLPPDRSK